MVLNALKSGIFGLTPIEGTRCLSDLAQSISSKSNASKITNRSYTSKSR